MPKTLPLLLLAVLSCGDATVAQDGPQPPVQPDPRNPWRLVTAAPAWVGEPPARRDHYRYTTSRRSNLPSIAQHGATSGGERAGTEHLLELLFGDNTFTDDQGTEAAAGPEAAFDQPVERSLVVDADIEQPASGLELRVHSEQAELHGTAFHRLGQRSAVFHTRVDIIQHRRQTAM